MSILGGFDAAHFGKITTLTTAFNAHKDAFSAHGATVAATPSRMCLRDAAGRVKVATPEAITEATNKGYVDGQVGDAANLVTGTLTLPWQPTGSKLLSVITVSGSTLVSGVAGQVHFQY